MNAPAIEMTDLTKTFLQGRTPIEVLKGVTLSLEYGESLAILGKSGSGKSTLLSLLAGLDLPTTGSIRVAGEDLTRLDEAALTSFRARTLGIVFQQFHLMSHLTALENIALPLELRGDANAFEKANESLSQVGLAARAAHFPSQLSGGERQRVAIARALVIQPALLLADEPSGNLDDRTGKEVAALLFDLVKKGKTTFILVTHDEALASLCHRRAILEEGRLTSSVASNEPRP